MLSIAGAAVVLASGVGYVGASVPAADQDATSATPMSVKLVDFGYASGTEGLTPALALAYTAASTEARREGVSMWITSGKRSYAEQQAMWRDGVAQYGSAAAARRWVLPPAESTHVSGRAIDVGPRAGAAWLQANGAAWGLCRTFDNEWWHFELVRVPGGVCPARLPDASAR